MPLRHPTPLPPPEGFKPCADTPDLYCRWEPAWGGSLLLTTETIAVLVFNGGHSLREVVLAVCGRDERGAEVFTMRRELTDLRRGETARLEVASYELPSPACNLGVTLVSGKVDLGA